MNSLRSLLAFFALSMGFHAHAGFLEWISRQLSKPPVDYGFWQCNNCLIPAPGTPMESSVSPADVQAFIKANNAEIHDSKGESVHRWIPKSTITICNSQGYCMTFMYPAATNIWLPVAGSYNLPVGKTPRTPRNPDVGGVSGQGTASSIGVGRVVLVPVGLPALTSSWAVVIETAPPRIVTPSVTIVQNGTSTTFVGMPVALNPINDSVGIALEWKSESVGLDPVNSGGGGAGGPIFEMLEN